MTLDEDGFQSYRNTYEFIRGDLSRFGYLGVFNLMVSYIVSMTVQLIMVFLNFAFIIPIILLVIGILLLTGGIVGLIMGIILIIIGFSVLFALFTALIGVILSLWVLIGGLNVYISEKLHDMNSGKAVKFERILKEALDRWKELAGKGARLTLAYMVVSLPVMLLMSLVSGLIMMGVLIGIPFLITDPVITTPLILLLLVVLSFGTILLYPVLFILAFIYDMTSIRISEGSGTKEALLMSLRNVRRDRRGVLLYCFGLFLIILAMNIIFPLAILGQGFLIVIMKSFVLSNRHLFPDHH